MFKETSAKSKLDQPGVVWQLVSHHQTGQRQLDNAETCFIELADYLKHMHTDRNPAKAGKPQVINVLRKERQPPESSWVRKHWQPKLQESSKVVNNCESFILQKFIAIKAVAFYFYASNYKGMRKHWGSLE